MVTGRAIDNDSMRQVVRFQVIDKFVEVGVNAFGLESTFPIGKVYSAVGHQHFLRSRNRPNPKVQIKFRFQIIALLFDLSKQRGTHCSGPDQTNGDGLR